MKNKTPGVNFTLFDLSACEEIHILSSLRKRILGMLN